MKIPKLKKDQFILAIASLDVNPLKGPLCPYLFLPKEGIIPDKCGDCLEASKHQDQQQRIKCFMECLQG